MSLRGIPPERDDEAIWSYVLCKMFDWIASPAVGGIAMTVYRMPEKAQISKFMRLVKDTFEPKVRNKTR